MKRQRIGLADLAERSNLVLASWKAARGKRQRPAVAAWFDALEQNLAHLAAGILGERVPVGRSHRFRIHDPKPRDITAACFADRVLPGAVWPGRRRWRRYREAAGRLQLVRGAETDDGLLQRAHDVALSALLPADSLARRRRLWWPGEEEGAL